MLIPSLLRYCSQHASKALPLGLAIGIVLPPAAQVASHLLPLSLLIPLVIAISRIEWQQQLDYLKRWPLMIAIALWILVACPLLIWSLLKILPVNEPLTLAAIMAAAAPPVTACAAIALFLKLDVAIVVVATVLSMLTAPFLLPIMAHQLLAIELNIPVYTLGLRLGGFIFTAFMLALIIKQWLGKDRINTYSSTMDGIAVIAIVCFIIGIMKGVGYLLLDRPLYAITTTLLAFVVIVVIQAVTLLVFWQLPRKTSLALAMMCGNCNLGLMYLILADQAEINTLVFFALGQIPMYTLPALQARWYKRLLAV
jgi:BASS family bile acid:Na+ symporter